MLAKSRNWLQNGLDMVQHGEIIPYGEQDGQRLVSWPAAELDSMQPGELLTGQETFLGTDIYQGVYGVASFGVVIPHPEDRPFYYYAEEGVCGKYTANEIVGWYEVEENPVRRMHYVDTHLGFAVDRTILAPVDAVKRLREDKFLGPALIDKCCLEGTVSHELDEERSLPLDSALGKDVAHEVSVTQRRIMNQLTETTGIPYVVLRQYPSWHGYRTYASTLSEIAEACKATVANFDEILAMLAKDLPHLHSLDKNTPLGRIAIAQTSAEAE